MTAMDVIEDAGGAEVRKVGVGIVEQHNLRREAELLRAAQHPGVVELLAAGEGELRARFVGPYSLETAPPLGVARAGAVVATVADTLADLHALGIVHGRVEPGHIVLDDVGRPVLCGFGGAAYIGTAAPICAPLPPELTDPAHAPGALADPSIDVFGLGAVLKLLVTDAALDAEPVPERRWSPARVRHPWPGHKRRALLNIAGHATADDPARRPTARQFAVAVRDVVPDPTAAPGASDGDDARAERRWPTLAGAIVGLALLFTGMSSLVGGSSRAGRAPAVVPAAVATSAIVAATSTPRSSAPCPAVVGVPAIDVTADGCVDGAVVVGNGVVVVGGTVRFAVGDPGDAVVVGDWDCNGVATPAVLRPTGAVFAFHGWASAGDESAERVGTAPGAVGLRASPDACPRVQGVARDGSIIEVTP